MCLQHPLSSSCMELLDLLVELEKGTRKDNLGRLAWLSTPFLAGEQVHWSRRNSRAFMLLTLIQMHFLDHYFHGWLLIPVLIGNLKCFFKGLELFFWLLA